jgi:acylphosphatase
MICQRLRISGQVQGVGYRDAMQRQAERLRITGWVRNRLDGTVEALVQGPQEEVDRLVAWARRGPPAARVDHVQVESQPAQERSYDRFEQHPTR